MSELKIKYVRLSDIKPADSNPKRHSDTDIQSSIKKHGFKSPLLRNSVTNKLVAGHGRTEALTHLYQSGADVPEHIKLDKDGMWLIPVLDAPFTSEASSNQYLLLDNRLSEIGGWDSAALAEMLEELERNSTALGLGWTQAEIDGLIAANQKVIEKATEEIAEQDDGDDDLLADLRGTDLRELVLHLDSTEYDAFTARLQKVMAARRLPGYVEAVSALLDFWEAGTR